jgi:hypothetical protein
MKLIIALAALGALTFAILAYAPADAETACYTSDSGAEKCWTIPRRHQAGIVRRGGPHADPG